AGEVFVTKNLTIERVALFKKPLRELLNLRPVSVTVTDEDTGKAVPARISIVDSRGDGAELFYVSHTNIAARSGIIYTPGTKTSFELPEGNYKLFATRGMEWSLAQQAVSLGAGQPVQVDFRIRRQVDTKGFIAADTHIHNINFSGHGDATVDERMLTLAGEGVELAVATDHNHVTDYRPYQNKWQLNSYFTSLFNDAMTTEN